MFKKIKQNALRKYVTKSLAGRDTSKRNSMISRLGFIVEEDFYDDFEALQQLGLALGVAENNIAIFSFVDGQQKAPTLRQNYTTPKDFNLFGAIKNQAVIDFLNTEFDALIGIYGSESNYLKALVARSLAHFKIGFSNGDDRLFDLIIDIDPLDERLRESELKKYLKILKKI